MGLAKTEAEIAERAARFLKAELKRSGMSYTDLATKLTEMGLAETEGSITVKINRGTFPAWFLIAAMQAIGREAIRISDV